MPDPYDNFLSEDESEVLQPYDSALSVARSKPPEPFLTIYNKHPERCGTPPKLKNASRDVYVGYFESPFNDQWVFTFDLKTHEASLRGGNTNWEKVYTVYDGDVSELTFGQEEVAWLQACWKAAQEMAS